MITFLEGNLVESTPLRAVINVSGIGYEVHIPITTAEKLPSVGQNVKLHTLAVYREDSATLYGFSTKADRSFFQLLVERVSGVGPRIALNMMSRANVETLRGAISGGDIKVLSSCPGIGKKTAERLIVELRDHLGTGPTASGTTTNAGVTPGSPRSDAVAALIALGFKNPDAEKAVERAAANTGADASTELLIRHALSRS